MTISSFAHRFRLFGCGMIAAAIMGLLLLPRPAFSSSARALSCDAMVSGSASGSLGFQETLTLQKNLKTLGYGPLAVNGKPGESTLQAGARFCKDFGLPQDFSGTLSHYALIAAAHPDWKEITLNPEFEFWINNQDWLQGDRINLLKRSGTAQQIIALLDRYKIFLQEQSVPLPTMPWDGAVSYVLTADDLKKLKEQSDQIDQKNGRKNTMVAQLEKFADQTFATKKEFLEAIEPIIRQGSDDADALLNKILDLSKKPPTFVLTEASFKQLKAGNIPDDLLEKLQALGGVPYLQPADLQQAVEHQIADYIAQLSQKYTLQITTYAEETTFYQINAEAVEKIKADQLPEDLIAQITPLQDVEFPTQKDLETAVKDKINQLNAEYRDYVPTILKQAKIILIYRLSDKSFATLANEQVPREIIAQLQPLKGKFYFRIKELQKEVKASLGELALTYWHYQDQILGTAEKEERYQLNDDSYKTVLEQGIPADIYEKVLGLKGRPYDSQEHLTTEVAAKIHEAVAGYDQYAEAAKNASEQTAGYELNAQIFRALSSGTKNVKYVPAEIVEILAPLAGQEYPRADLFLQAVQYRTSQYQRDILAALDALGLQNLDEETFAALREHLKAKAVPAGVLAALAGLQGKSFASVQAFKAEVKTTIESFYQQLWQSELLKNLILRQAKKTHRFETAQEPNWVSNSCDCGPEYEKQIYGFYPFWAADSEQPAEPAPAEEGKEGKASDQAPTAKVENIDFSGLSRIGYFGLPFDKEGRFPEKLPWREGDEKNARNFVIEAHRYKSKVDLVVYGTQWAEWAKAAISGSFQDKAVDDLAEAMLQYAFTPFKSTLETPFSQHTFDGLTLSFEGFPAESAYAPLFIQLIRRLNEKLKARNDDYHLNLVLAVSDLGKEPFTYENLKNMVADHDDTASSTDPDSEETPGVHNLVDSFLVYLEEPTTRKKKDLRSLIEINFDGYQRRNMLRKIVPIVNSRINTEEQLEQFKKDLIYLEDNFAGVGLWPVPHSDDPQLVEMNIHLKETFKKAGEQSSFSPDFLNDICPKRWVLYLVWDALVLVLLFLAAAAYYFFEIRKLLLKFWPIYLGLASGAVVLTVALLKYSRSSAKLQSLALWILLGIVVLYLGRQLYTIVRHKNYP